MSAIDFRFTGGLQQGLGRRDLPPPALDECTNIVWEKGNVIRRRDGFGAAGAGATLADSTRGPHAMVSVGGQLLAVGSDGTHVDQVYAGSPVYLDQVGALTLTGSGPFTPLSAYLGVDESPAAPTPITDCDMAAGPSYQLVAWASSDAITLELRTLGGVRVWRRVIVSGATSPGVRVVAYATAFYVAYNIGTDLRVFSFDPSDTPPASLSIDFSLATLASATSAWDFTATADGVAWIAQTGANVQYEVAPLGVSGAAVTIGTADGAAQCARISYAGSKYHFSYVNGSNEIAISVGGVTSLDYTDLLTSINTRSVDLVAVDADTCILVYGEASETLLVAAWEHSTGTLRTTASLLASTVSRMLVDGTDVYMWLSNAWPDGAAFPDVPTAVSASVLHRLGSVAGLSEVSGSDTETPTPLAVAHQGRTGDTPSTRLPSLVASSRGLATVLPEVFALDSSDEELVRPSVVEAHAITAGDYSRSVAVLGGVALLSGAYPRYTDGAALSPAIDTVPIVDVSGSASGGTIPAGTYAVRVTYEWRLGGLRFQSGASIAESVTTTGTTSSVTVSQLSRVPYHTPGVYMVAWLTADGGTTYYRAAETELSASATTTLTVTSVAGVTDNEQLYSNVEPDRYAPPSFECVGVAGRRLWGGHGRRVYYSQPLDATGEAPQFCGAVFFEEFPEPVTGIGESDEQPVVFTASRTFVLRGPGPDRVGGGGWQVDEVSGELGCIDQRSIARTDKGLFFQSRRGIEVLPTGAQSIQYVGAGVEDELATRPVVGASVVDAARQFVLFSITPARDPVSENLDDGSDPEPSGGRVLMYDTEAGAWSSWQAFGTDKYGNSVPSLAVHDGDLVCGYDFFDPIVYRYGADLDGNSQTGSAQPPALYDHEAIVRTGEIRPSGLTGEGQFGAIRAVGEVGAAGQVTPLDVRVSHDQSGRFDPAELNATTETFQWFSGDDFDPLPGLTVETGTPWERQYTPATSRRTSISIELKWSGGNTGGPGDCLRLYGVSIEYTADGRQQRLSAGRSK